jgi:hypothetical protein
MRGRNYSRASTLENMQRFWVCCRQTFPYRIGEELRVTRALLA